MNLLSGLPNTLAAARKAHSIGTDIWETDVAVSSDHQLVLMHDDATMRTTDLPELFVNADPGAILTGPHRDFCRTWRNQTEVTVAGIHFVQEDSPQEIGRALAEWLPLR